MLLNNLLTDPETKPVSDGAFGGEEWGKDLGNRSSINALPIVSD